MVSPAALSIILSTFAEGPERNRALAVWGATGTRHDSSSLPHTVPPSSGTRPTAVSNRSSRRTAC